MSERLEAIKAGRKRYFIPTPCVYGHISERLVSNRSCISCSTEKKLQWASDNKALLSKRKRERRAANPEKERNYERGRYKADPRPKMITAAKRRAKERGIIFDISIDDIEMPATCPLLGIKLCVGGGAVKDNSPSIDRIKNSLGYIKGNVIVVSHIANRCKGNLDAAGLFRLARNLRKLEKQRGLI